MSPHRSIFKANDLVRISQKQFILNHIFEFDSENSPQARVVRIFVCESLALPIYRKIDDRFYYNPHTRFPTKQTCAEIEILDKVDVAKHSTLLNATMKHKELIYTRKSIVKDDNIIIPTSCLVHDDVIKKYNELKHTDVIMWGKDNRIGFVLERIKRERNRFLCEELVRVYDTEGKYFILPPTTKVQVLSS